MTPNASIALTYFSGLVLIVSSFTFGQFESGLLVLGVLFVLIGAFSKTSLGVVKYLDNRFLALTWTVLAIFTAFGANLFDYTSNKNLLLGTVTLSLINLIFILISKFKLDENN